LPIVPDLFQTISSLKEKKTKGKSRTWTPWSTKLKQRKQSHIPCQGIMWLLFYYSHTPKFHPLSQVQFRIHLAKRLE
jgi:hypothetical protein